VMRAEQPLSLLHADGSDLAREFPMIRLMQQHGMPVAEALWLEEDTQHLGARFIISRKAVGKPIGGNFGSFEPLTGAQIESFLSNFSRLHAIRLDAADPLVQQSHFREWVPHKTIRDVTRYVAGEYLPRMIARSGIRFTPQLRRALRWMECNAPDSDQPAVIVHIDYAFNNMIFDGDRLSALLDWETSRLGDPADDIIWTQFNLGVYPMPEFLQKYRERTGRDVSEYRIAYARLGKCIINLIAGLTALKCIDAHDAAPPEMGLMAFRFMPMLGTNVDELIAQAESLPRR
jgi:aminoglycoside phosphotransferase (APT) family kinase protein